jgi:hypothetical protein
MTQQINLFNPGLRPQRTVPALAWALAGGGLVISLALGYYARLDGQLSRLQAENARVDAEMKALLEQVSKIKPGSTQARSQALEKSIAQAESELKEGEAVLSRLSGGGLGNTKGFSEYMTALARQRQQGVWITGLIVSGDGTQFAIRGGALNAEIVPQYIRRLSREEVLQGLPIADLQLQRKEMDVKDPGAGRGPGTKAEAPQKLRFVEFSMSSQAGGFAFRGG